MEKPDWFNLRNYAFLYDLHPVQQLFLFQKKAGLIEDLRNYALTPNCLISANATWAQKSYQALFRQGKVFSDEDIEQSESFLSDYEEGYIEDSFWMFSIKDELNYRNFTEHLSLLMEGYSTDQKKDMLFLQIDLTKPKSLIKKQLIELVDDLYKHEKVIKFGQNPLLINSDGHNERQKSIKTNQLFPYMDLILNDLEYDFKPTEIANLLHEDKYRGDMLSFIKYGDETKQT